MKNEKHQFLYDYGRAAFEDELQRFRNIEDKAAKYLSFLSIGIVGYSLILRSFSSAFFPPGSVFQWLACIAVAFTYLALVSAWSFLYRALQFMEMPRLPFDDRFIDFYEPQTLPTIQFALTRTCSRALEYAREGNRKKSDLLIKGYRDIGYAMWSLTLSAILIVSSNWIGNLEEKMPDDDKKNQSSENQTSAEPDKSVPPPDVTFVLDHKIPDLDKGKEQINESDRKSGKK